LEGRSLTEPDATAVEVIVKLAWPADAGESSVAERSVYACAGELGITLEPLYGSTRSELDGYLVGRVDPAAADTAVERLLACPGVEGAYVKPRGEPPRGA
jgi:hypothetical protein